MPDEKRSIDDEIEEQTATALPKREAMSVIAPPPISGVLKAEPTDPPVSIDPPPPNES